MNIFTLLFNKIYYSSRKYHNKRTLVWRSDYWRNDFKNKTGDFMLDDNQTKSVKDFYGKFDICFDVTDLFHRFYTEKTGKFDLYNIPDDIYYCYVDRYFNDWDKALAIDNKCLYSRLFAGVNQPETVLTRMNGIWTDSEHRLVDKDTISEIISACDEVVVKQACESEGGKNIFFISGTEMTKKFFDAVSEIQNDIVVQKTIKQHREISRINSSSINTIRILSLLSQEGVKIYSSVIRMGVDGSRVDNACSGGITCGIKADGSLKEVAYSAKGDKYYSHPTSGIKFDSVKIPSFDKACELVKRLHPSFPDYRLISWDVAIDENSEPLLIEANLRYGELDFHQLNNGPVFGEDTEKILKEVFKK